MSDEVPWYVSLIISWLPFLLLIGTAIWMASSVCAAFRTKDGRAVAQVLDDHVRELRRTNELLAESLKRRPDGPRTS